MGIIPDLYFLPTETLAVVVTAVILILSSLAIFTYFIFYYRKIFKKTVAEVREGFKDDDDLLNFEVAYFHEIGKRKRQEDAYYISPLNRMEEDGVVVCVSDGMGGMEFGDQISSEIVSSVEAMCPLAFDDQENISENIKLLSNRICTKYEQKGGATLAMIHIFDNMMNFYSVGDSDIILIRNNEATILNPRQNFVSILIRNLAQAGKQTQVAYANKRSRALVDYIGNVNPRVIYTKKPIRIMDGDAVIVSSDGLTDAIPWNMLPKFMTGSARNAAFNLKMSVKHIKHPKQDNYTAVVMRFRRGLI